MAKKKLTSEDALGAEVERVLNEDEEETEAIMKEAKKILQKIIINAQAKGFHHNW